MKRLTLVILSMLLVSCGGGGGGDVAVVDTSQGVHINCADVHNGSKSRCDPTVNLLDYFIGTAYAAIDLNAGALSKGCDDACLTGTLNLATVRVDVTNPLTEARTIWWEARFSDSFDCKSGVIPWVIAPKQSIKILPGRTVNLNVSGMCSPAPLGPHTITATVWDTDGVTVLDFAIVRFTLIE